MDFIPEIVLLLKTFQPKKIEIIGNNKISDTKINLFFQYVKDGEIKTDEEAMMHLYGNNKESKKNYNKLKSRLKEKLINATFFLDLNSTKHTDIQKSYYQCHKNWASTKILFGRGVKGSAVILAEKTIKKAVKFEFTEIVINLSRTLRLHFATMEGNKKKFNHYNNLLSEYMPILQAELKAEEYYEKLLIHFANSKATKSELAATAKIYSQDLKQYKNTKSYNYLLNSHTVFVLRYEIINDHHSVIRECAKALIELKAKPFSLKNQLFGFLIKQFSCYLKLGQYEEAKALVVECRDTLTEGTGNWFVFNHLYFCLLTYTKDYHLIDQNVSRVIAHPQLKFKNNRTKETWKIIQAYTVFLYEARKIDSIEKQSNFKIGRYLNEVPKFSKDKRGANIHILITQILIALARKKYNFIIDKTAALSRYTSRYLKKDETYRSNCFIQILINLPRGNFHKDSFQFYAKKYIKKLQEAPLSSARQSSEFEFIPYEVLLEYVVELCKE